MGSRQEVGEGSMMATYPPAAVRLVRFFAACLVLLGLAGCGVNDIPTRDERAKATWGEVENQYQRRADLIPNLVETVKGYAAHEKDVLESVVRARAAAVAQPPGPDVLSDPGKFHDYEQRQN
jgi:LemA protein